MAAMRLDTVAETSALCFFLFSLFFFLLNASSPFAIVVRGEREERKRLPWEVFAWFWVQWPPA